MRIKKSTHFTLCVAWLAFLLFFAGSVLTMSAQGASRAYSRQSALQLLGSRSRFLHSPFVQRLKKQDDVACRPLRLTPALRQAGPANAAPAPRKTLLATTANGTQIWGYIDNADSWSDTYGTQSNYPDGFYAFTPGSSSYSKLFEMTGVDINGGAAIYDNIFHGISYSVDWTTYEFVLHYYEYNTLDWTPTENNGKAVPNNSLELMAACTAVDATNGNTVYGCVSNSDMSSSSEYLLATIDYDHLSYKKIKEMDSPYVAMAINGSGVLYAITSKGALVTVDKSTGEETAVGSTGVTPSRNFMSAAFDPATGTLYWAATTKDGQSAIYSVNTTTGQATPVSTFTDGENISYLYVKEAVAEGAPAEAEDLKATFVGEALGGLVSFTVPTKTHGGQTLTGKVQYTLSDNGKQIAQGEATPGQALSLQVTADNGSHVYSVVLSNAAGQSNATQAKVWVGKDVAKAVSGLTLSIEGGKASLIWGAPTQGSHGGYLDPAKVTYDVVRFPDNAVVAKNLAATSFTETLPAAPYTAYYYKVVANYEGEQSEWASSNIVCAGAALVPPYKNTFSSIDSTYTYSVVDNNGDGVTWSYADGAMMYLSMMANDDADDWIVTPPFHLKGDRQYLVTFRARSYSESDVEHYGLAIGPDAEDEVSNYTLLVADTSVHSTIPVPVSKVVTVKSEGDYRFAIKAVGNTGLAEFVNGFAVDEGSLFSAPDSVQHLTVTPDANGALKTSISMTAPSKTVNGQPLSGKMSVKVYRGSVSPESLVKTVDNVSAGQSVTVDDTPLVGGITTYYAVASNGSGDGLQAHASAYVGFDTPLAPAHIVLKDMLDGTAQLSWDNPQDKGTHGGAVDKAHLTYNIYSVNDGTPSLLKSGVSGTSYNVGSVTDNGKQQLTYYAMKAVAGDLQSSYGISSMLMTGAPYTLPFSESFAGGKASSFWASNVVRGNDDEDFGYTTLFAADNDKGCAFYNTSSQEGEAILSSGKVSLSGAAYPYLYFSYYALPGEDIQVRPLVYVNGSEADTLQIIDYAQLGGADGWRKVMIDLGKYTSAKYIVLGFDAHITGSKYPVLIDAVKVRDDYPYDLEAAIDAPTKIKAGDNVTVSILVNNAGFKAIGKYHVNLLVNGKVAETKEGTSLDVNADATYAFSYKVPVTSDSTLKVQGQVVTDLDMDDSNDTTAMKTVEVYQPSFPAISDLKAAKAAQGVALTWSTAQGHRNTVSEGFEDYDAFSISNVGEWTLVDGDKAATYSVSSTTYDHANGKFAYIVFNPSDISATDASILPHGGKQYMASMASPAADTPEGHNDDWLISPQLSGKAQTVAFWVKSLNSNYGLEKYQVLYSTTNTDTASFKLLTEAEAPAEAWQEVKADLPEGARYFAIRCVSEERFMFMVDDVTYDAQPLQVEGYNVYRDGQLVAKVGADATSYTDAGGNDGSVYQVSVVYSVGESALSNKASVLPTAITSVSADGLQVYAADGRILVRHAQGKHIAIYRLSGQQVLDVQGKSDVDCAVRPGIYLVHADSKVVKVIVK